MVRAIVGVQRKGSGFPFKRWFLISLIVVLVGEIALVVLNPHNPAYNPADRTDLDAQAQTIRDSGSIQGERWRQLIQSANTECYYNAGPPQEYIVAGTLSDNYIVPGSGAIRWYMRFPAKLQNTLFGDKPKITLGVTTQQNFYFMVKNEGFSPCTEVQATRARGILGS